MNYSTQHLCISHQSLCTWAYLKIIIYSLNNYFADKVKSKLN